MCEGYFRVKKKFKEQFIQNTILFSVLAHQALFL